MQLPKSQRLSNAWFGSGKSLLFLDIEQNIWTNLRDGVDAQR
jgi:hypothetical protein